MFFVLSWFRIYFRRIPSSYVLLYVRLPTPLSECHTRSNFLYVKLGSDSTTKFSRPSRKSYSLNVNNKYQTLNRCFHNFCEIRKLFQLTKKGYVRKKNKTVTINKKGIIVHVYMSIPEL